MPKWTDYTTKTTVADNDEIMTLDTAGKANKRLSLSILSDWVLGKIADKVFEKLQTNDKTILGAINELNSKSSIEYVNGTFSPIYSITLDSGTTQYDLSKYPTYSTLLIFYANGGVSILSIWLGSYSLIELKKSMNGIQVSCDFSTKKMSVIVPEKVATILSIIQIK